MSAPLRGLALHSAKVIAIANVARQALQLGTVFGLASMLGPGDFGLYGLLSVFIAFAQLLGSLGTAQAVIHKDGQKFDQLWQSSVHTFNVLFGIGLTGLLIVLAPVVGSFYGDERIAELLRLMSFSFLFGSFLNVPRALLEKSLRFFSVALIETISLAAGCTSAIAMAMYGWGVTALVSLPVVNTAVSLLMYTAIGSFRGLNLTLRASDIRGVFRFSAELTGFNILNYFARSVDTFIIGKMYGAAELGAYSLAYKVMLYPLDNVARVIVRVLFPTLARLQTDNVRFRRAYKHCISGIASVSFPLMTLVALLARDLIPVVLGANWSSAAPVLVVLAPIGLLQSILTTTGAIHSAKGETSSLFRVGLVNSSAICLGIVIGAPFGVFGIACTYAATIVLITYPTLKVSWGLIDLRVSEGVAALLPFLVCSCVAASAVIVARALLVQIQPSYLSLIGFSAVGAGVYVVSLRLLYRERAVEIWRMLRRND